MSEYHYKRHKLSSGTYRLYSNPPERVVFELEVVALAMLRILGR